MADKSFLETLSYRRSVRVYTQESLDPQQVQQCIEQATLAPNSSNLQLWEFYHVTSAEKKAALAEACLNQSAAKTAQEFVVFVVRKDLWKQRAQANVAFLKAQFDQQQHRNAKREKMALNYYQKLIPTLYTDFWGIAGRLKRLFATLKGWSGPMYRQVLARDLDIVAHKSTALAAQTFMLSMAHIGYDTCPMEGFDSVRVKKTLGVPHKAMISMVVSCGIRDEKGIYGQQFRVPFTTVYNEI